MKQGLDEIAALRAEVEHYKRVAEDGQSVNRDLRAEVERLKGERDSALSTLEGMDVLLDPAKKLEQDNDDLRAKLDKAEGEMNEQYRRGLAAAHLAMCNQGYWTADEAQAAIDRLIEGISSSPEDPEPQASSSPSEPDGGQAQA
jgi:chromosome segregation ATPase